MGIFFTQNGLWAMEKCRLVPKGTHAIGNDLATAAEALIAGGQTKLFTPMALWVCTKVSHLSRLWGGVMMLMGLCGSPRTRASGIARQKKHRGYIYCSSVRGTPYPDGVRYTFVFNRHVS